MTTFIKLKFDDLLSNFANTGITPQFEEQLNTFFDLVIRFCEEENVFTIYRFLKLLEGELLFKDCFINNSFINVKDRILFFIRTEQRLVEI